MLSCPFCRFEPAEATAFMNHESANPAAILTCPECNLVVGTTPIKPTSETADAQRTESRIDVESESQSTENSSISADALDEKNPAEKWQFGP